MSELRLICIDAEAPPLFSKSHGGHRDGYEPDAAALVAERLGRELRWIFRPWQEMVPALLAGEGDGVWCGQGITEERRKLVDFTRPYAVFDEAALVCAGSAIAGPDDLRGRRVGAIAHSTNMALAETFGGAVTVSFDGSSADVFGEMISSLRAGEIDALIDDDVALVPLADDPAFEVAFTVPTRNAWGISVSKERPEWRGELDGALRTVIGDGRLETVWRRWMPNLVFPFAALR